MSILTFYNKTNAENFFNELSKKFTDENIYELGNNALHYYFKDINEIKEFQVEREKEKIDLDVLKKICLSTNYNFYQVLEYLIAPEITNNLLRSNLNNLMNRSGIRTLTDLEFMLKSRNLSISRQTLSKLLNNDKIDKMEISIFYKLKIFFNCSFDELFS